MKTAQSKFWDAWELQARAELKKELGHGAAKRVVRYEREQRERAALLIGDKAAASADLILDIRPDGTFSLHARVPEKNVPSALLPRAKAWEAGPQPTRQ